MKCEFEEKSYESLLNLELAGARPIIYPVGQVFENAIGIDAAIFSRNQAFWELWRHIPPFWGFPPGVYLDAEFWDILEHELNTAQFPKFKVNIFIQYKRPEYISSPLGKEYRYWDRPYFRYDINPPQQDILGRLEQNLSSSSIVVYACSAFWRYNDLWDFSSTHQLIQNSNFVQPHKLNNHQRYTFVNGGNIGKAFSEPVDIESVDFIKMIDIMFKTEKRFKNNVDFIYSVDKSIMQVVEQFEGDYFMAFKSLIETIKIPPHKLAKSIIDILVFSFITNTYWGIGYEE